MSTPNRKKLAIATVVYWILLLYIIAALVFWFIELQLQNLQMSSFKLQQLMPGDPELLNKSARISLEEHRKTIQYLSEGSTFMVLILIGAIFVYRAVRRQIRLQLQQQNFMMAVTHELKTPIAVTKLNLETLQRYRLDEARQQKILQSAIQETNRLDTLANNILVSAQLEGGARAFVKNEVDLSALAKETAGEFRNRFADRNWEIIIQPGLMVFGDTLLLQIVVNNLIENAIKYSPKEGLISVLLQAEQGHIILRVKDQGPGVPAAEKKKIFEKFYRVGNEQTRTAQGTGLGLYLCKKIALDHQADIAISDNSPTGTVFRVSFD